VGRRLGDARGGHPDRPQGGCRAKHQPLGPPRPAEAEFGPLRPPEGRSPSRRSRTKPQRVLVTVRASSRDCWHSAHDGSPADMCFSTDCFREDERCGSAPPSGLASARCPGERRPACERPEAATSARLRRRYDDSRVSHIAWGWSRGVSRGAAAAGPRPGVRPCNGCVMPTCRNGAGRVSDHPGVRAAS
jgi:hypothetical protein